LAGEFPENTVRPARAFNYVFFVKIKIDERRKK